MDAKVAVAIPSYNSVPSMAFAHIMSAVVGGLQNGLIAEVDISVGLYVTVSRNRLAASVLQSFRDGRCTHVWWIDDDVIVRPDTLEKLLAWEKPAVSGLYYARECIPMAYDLKVRTGTLDPVQYKLDLPNEGLVQVGGVGMGCFLMDIQILEDMYQKFCTNQWFQTPAATPELDYPGEIGEDVFFCHRLGEMDVPIYVDCGAECGHARYFDVNRSLVHTLDKGMEYV